MLLKFLFVFLIVVSNVFASDWTTFQHDAQHTGVNNEITFTFPLELRWEKEISSGPLNQITVVGEKAIVTNKGIYFHNRNCGFIVCLNANTGDSLWGYSFENSNTHMSQATYGLGNVYFQKSRKDSAAFIASYNLATGEKNWHGTYPSQIAKPIAPTIYDSLLIPWAADALVCPSLI